MEQNQQQSASEFRCLFATEIADTVRNRRELYGMKQLTLAQKAGVTERTIQRLESGLKVDDETLGNVAEAIGLARHSFVGPRTVRGVEQAIGIVSEFFDKHQFVEAEPVVDWRLMEALMHVHAVVVDDTELDGVTAKMSAELREYLAEIIDCADLLTPSQRLDYASMLLEKLRAIESTGVVGRVAICKTDDGFSIGALLLFPTAHERAKISQTLMPKKFIGVLGPGPSEDDIRIADSFVDALRATEKQSR